MVARYFRIKGQVHGVGFRVAMRSEARRLQLAGWVRNCADGSVEAVAAGDQAALDQLTAWGRHGPPAAKVREISSRAATDAEAVDVDDPFSYRPSA